MMALLSSKASTKTSSISSRPSFLTSTNGLVLSSTNTSKTTVSQFSSEMNSSKISARSCLQKKNSNKNGTTTLKMHSPTKRLAPTTRPNPKKSKMSTPWILVSIAQSSWPSTVTPLSNSIIKRLSMKILQNSQIFWGRREPVLPSSSATKSNWFKSISILSIYCFYSRRAVWNGRKPKDTPLQSIMILWLPTKLACLGKSTRRRQKSGRIC